MDEQEVARRRREVGMKMFEEVTCTPCPAPSDPMTEFTVDTIFSEIWTRGVLTRKERRWISITAASLSGNPIAIGTHLRAAVESGDITIEELQEFALHLGIYAGMPNAVAPGLFVRQLAEERKAKP